MTIARLADGTELRFPEGTSDAVVQKAVREHLGAQGSNTSPAPTKLTAPPAFDKQNASIPRTILDKTLNGLTFGFGDEITGTAGGVLAPLLAKLQGSNAFEDATDPNLISQGIDSARATGRAEAAQNPGTSITSELGGGVLAALLSGGVLNQGAPRAASALQSFAAASPYKTALGVGAGSGALYGAGGGEGNIQERGGDALLGGGVGMLAGPAATYVGRNAIAPLTSKLMDNAPAQSALVKLQSIFEKKPETGKAGSVVEAAENAIDVTPTFTPGLNTPRGEIFAKTGGQRLQDPNLQRLEVEARAGGLTKDAEAAIRNADITQNREYHGFIDKLAGGKLDKNADVDSLVGNVAATIKTRAGEAYKGVRSAYDLTKEGSGVTINSSDINKGLWTKLNDIREEGFDIRSMPQMKNVVKDLANLSGVGLNNVTAGKLQALERVRSMATKAAYDNSGKSEGVFAGRFVRAYDDFMEETAANAVDVGDAKAINAFKDAVKQRASYGKLFESNKLVNDIVEGKAGIDDITKKLVATGSIKNQKEMANNFNAIIKASGDQAPIVQNDLRQAFTKRMFERASGGFEPGSTSVEMISPAKLLTEMENMFEHQGEFAKKLYGEDVVKAGRQAIKELNVITSQQASTRNPSGSSEAFIRFLKSPVLSKISAPIAKIAEMQKAHTQGIKVEKGLSEFLNEEFKPQSTFWAIQAPVGVNAIQGE